MVEVLPVNHGIGECYGMPQITGLLCSSLFHVAKTRCASSVSHGPMTVNRTGLRLPRLVGGEITGLAVGTSEMEYAC